VPRLAALAHAHPKLEIDLRLQDQVIDLVGEGVDLAVRGGVAPPDSASLIAHRLTTFRRAPVASPTYRRRAGTPRHPRELERHDGLEWLVDERLERLCEGWTTPEIHAWAIHRIELRSAPRIRAAIEVLSE
jgi:DNA-binding transcriptional LysR family regulator